MISSAANLDKVISFAQIKLINTAGTAALIWADVLDLTVEQPWQQNIDVRCTAAILCKKTEDKMTATYENLAETLG